MHTSRTIPKSGYAFETTGIKAQRGDAEVAGNVFEGNEPEWLVYHAPAGYVSLLLHGDGGENLRNVTEQPPRDWGG